MEARASAKYLRGSPQKARLVIDLIRGKSVNEARAILQYTHKRAADGIFACVMSAVANATESAEKANIAIDPDDLWVKACFVDQGPTKNRRRMRPAPQGRAYKERRHFCHITVLLSSDDQPEMLRGNGKTRARAAARAARPATATPGAKRVTNAPPRTTPAATTPPVEATAPAVTTSDATTNITTEQTAE